MTPRHPAGTGRTYRPVGAAAGKMKTGYQATHDPGVSEMYLRLVRENPADAAR